MDALVPARTSGTPSFATVMRHGARRSVSTPVRPHRFSAERRRRPVFSHKPRWAGSARQLARRKPSRRQDEHPP
jgi:hypothetical protein